MKVCQADDCFRSAARHDNGKLGYCSMHYQRFKRHGDATLRKAVPSPAKDWLIEYMSHDGDQCLIWPFHIGEDGYGRVHRFDNGSLTTASNLMCELVHGPRPSKRHECAHSCGKGNSGCVHPKHIRWATPQENQQERVVHGTSNRGQQQWNARLTDDDVRQIRLMASTHKCVDIAKEFGLHQSYVSQIINRKRWAWLE